MTDPQARIAQLEAELATLRREMQDFTGTVSHDLRAPLRHIVSYAALVQEDAGPQLSPEVRGFLDTITDSAQHLGRMLDGLLALSRIGTAPLQLQCVPLAPLLQALIDELSARWVQQHPMRAPIVWEVTGVDAAASPGVLADPALLRLALGQLLDNAVKFSAPRDTVVVAVRAAVEAEASSHHPHPGLRLTVRDHGVGFSPAQQARLFQAFGRLHGAQQFAGLGLGLAMARKALERCQASVALAGVPDAGCTATVWLPVGPCQEPGLPPR